MAIVWADFPSGQRGLYGTNRALASNGIWTFEGTHEDEFISISSDPDPTIGDAGCVLRFNQDRGDSFGLVVARFTYPAAVVTGGFAFRLWLNRYPLTDLNKGEPRWGFRNISNGDIIYFTVGASGQIKAYNSAGTFINESGPSAVEVNAFNHIETKVLRDAAAGTAEVRVNGTAKLTLTGQALGANNIVNIFAGQGVITTPGSAVVAYFKDMVFWDGTGTYATDFQGSVAVYDLYADADISLNWTPSIGALGYPLIGDYYPSNTLTASGAISDGNVVRIDNTYYRFSTGSLDTGAPAGTSANPWKVLIGGTVADSLLNLFKAIGATGVAGTDYSTALTAHTTVDANGVTATQVSVTAKNILAAAIVTTETGANLAWVSGTLINGATDPSYIAAPFPAPAAAVFSLTNLPPDVTSVRALLPIYRAQKSDGGDCNVQSGLSPDNATWVNGADQPLTTAFTYWWSVSHTDPVTVLPWTPGAVNGAYVRMNRTL